MRALVVIVGIAVSGCVASSPDGVHLESAVPPTDEAKAVPFWGFSQLAVSYSVNHVRTADGGQEAVFDPVPGAWIRVDLEWEGTAPRGVHLGLYEKGSAGSLGGTPAASARMVAERTSTTSPIVLEVAPEVAGEKTLVASVAPADFSASANVRWWGNVTFVSGPSG